MVIPSADSTNAALRAEWPAILEKAASEVLLMMAGIRVSTSPDFPDVLSAPQVNITGTVGIAGALSAILSLRCSAACAATIASGMLGVPAAEAAEHQCDAIGEVCNIVAGDFKAKIGLEDKCMLSVPTVVTGGNYSLHTSSTTHRLESKLFCEGEFLIVALHIQA